MKHTSRFIFTLGCALAICTGFLARAHWVSAKLTSPASGVAVTQELDADATTTVGKPSANAPESRAEPSGFTITLRRTETQGDAALPVLVSTERTYRARGGAFHDLTTRHHPDGSTAAAVVGTETARFGVPGRGIFQVDKARRTLHLIAPFAAEEATQDFEAALRADARYTRDDTVLGYRTLVLRDPEGTGNEASEAHYAPDLQGALLKVTVVTAGRTTTVEATEVSVGEPDRAMFDLLSSYTVDTTQYEKRIERMERQGQAGAAAVAREHGRRARRQPGQPPAQ